MKTSTIVIIIICALVLFTAREPIKNFVQSFINDEEAYNDEQQSAIDEFKEGAGNIFGMMKKGLFSLDELIHLGILDGENPLKSLGEKIDNDNKFSMSDIDINSLNLENLSAEQTSILMQVISGNMTMTELVTSGEFTMKNLQDMGLFDVIMDNIGKSDE